MPKVLIVENCIINYGDDRGGVDAAIGAITDVNKDVAVKLTVTGRALYIDKSDDPTKGRYFADASIVKAAKAAAEEKAAQAAAEA